MKILASALLFGMQLANKNIATLSEKPWNADIIEFVLCEQTEYDIGKLTIIMHNQALNASSHICIWEKPNCL